MNYDNNLEIIKRIEEYEKKQLQSLMRKNGSNIDILETIYLGEINNNNIYRISEDDNKDNYSAILYKYYDENMQIKAIKNVRKDGIKEWIYLDEQWEELKDEIDLNEIQLEEEIEQVLADLEKNGKIKDDSILTEVDLEQEIKEEQEPEKEEGIETETKKEIEKEENQDEKKKEQTREYNDFEQEINTSVDVDHRGTTLAKGLGLEGYSKILIIHPEKLSEIRDENGEFLERTTQTFAVLGVTERDGKQVVEKIPDDKLTYHRGYNEQSVRFDDDGQVEKNSNVCEMFVGANGKGLIVDRSELEVKVYYSAGRDIKDNTQFAVRVKDSTVGLMKTDTQRNVDTHKGEYLGKDINEELEFHEKDKGEKIDEKNADGDKKTISTHIHEIDTPNDKVVFEDEYITAEEAAEKMGVSVIDFIREYNKSADELHGKEEIDIEEDLYDKMKERIEEKQENQPQREEGGRTPGEYDEF